MRTGIIENSVLQVRESLATPPTQRDFRFTTDASKIEAFDRWLQAQAERDILDVYGGENQYITRAYRSGVREAGRDLQALNIVEDAGGVATSTRLPVHREQLEALYTRNFGALQGMTDATANEMRRTLSEGLAGGDGPYDIARDLSDRIEKVGRHRANMIARTETLNSHNTARATEYQRHGVEKVTIVLAATACPECQALQAGAPYPADEAAGLLPRHPNCRCSLAPVIDT